MQSRVIFRDGMDNDPADYNRLQDFVQRASDDLIADGITADRRFAGFVTAISGVAEITTQPGRLYSGGKVFARDTAFTKDFSTALPIATKKIVLLVVFGQESDTAAVPREFLINEETGASEPRVVAMERARICNINIASGQESPDPIDPILDAGVLPIARILLAPTGVASVEMLGEHALDSIQAVADRTAALEAFQTRTGPQIVALGSDMASLRVGVANLVDQAAYGRTLVRLAAVETAQGIPAAATDSAADFFLDESRTDAAFAGASAKVEEGVRFAPDAVSETQLAVFDALNPRSRIVGNVLFPAYTRELRMAVGPRQSEAQIAAYSYQSHGLTQKLMARTRIRYGEEYIVASSVGFWGAVAGSYVGRTFARHGEAFQVVASYGTGPQSVLRVRRYWTDTYHEAYWSYATLAHAVPGAQIAETFLNANDLWLDAVGITFTRLAADGGVTVSICEVERGAPKLDAAVSVTTVQRATLQLGRETVIPVQPVFLEGGKRYAIVLITAADHWVATTQGSNFPQGTFFYVLDGAYQQGDGTRDLCFSLHACKFTQARVVVDMAPLSLAGGITALDILAESVVPKSCDLTYEVQVGGVWTPIGATDVSILGAGGNIPALLPLRAVLTGTPDVMPAVKLTDSRVRVSRPKLALTHVSTVRTLPAASSQIRVIARLEGFDAVHHTATARLRTGAGYTTLVAASSFVDVRTADGAVDRTWIFNLGASVTAYRIQLEAATDSALRVFQFASRKDYAL